MSEQYDPLDDAFETSKGRESGGGQLAKLPEGKHTFTVLSAEYKIKPKAKVFVLKIAADVGAERFEGTKDYFLEGSSGVVDMNVDNVKSDLTALGFDVDQWTRANQRPFSLELAKVGSVVGGIKFEGAKKTNAKDGKTYVNIYINARCKDDGKPLKIGAAELAAAVAAKAEENPF